MEADLQAVYGIDYRDRWRRDPDTGRARLTYRRLAVLVHHLPDTSATVLALDSQPRWRLEHILLAHIWQAAAQSKKPHPMLAAAERGRRRAGPSPDRQKRLRAATRRARERRRLIETGVIT